MHKHTHMCTCVQMTRHVNTHRYTDTRTHTDTDTDTTTMFTKHSNKTHDQTKYTPVVLPLAWKRQGTNLGLNHSCL